MCLPHSKASPIHKHNCKLTDEAMHLNKSDIYKKFGINMPAKSKKGPFINNSNKPLTAEFINEMGVKREFFIPLAKFDVEASSKKFEKEMDHYRHSEKNLKVLNNYPKIS